MIHHEMLRLAARSGLDIDGATWTIPWTFEGPPASLSWRLAHWWWPS
jgi:hypothetical protein